MRQSIRAGVTFHAEQALSAWIGKRERGYLIAVEDSSEQKPRLLFAWVFFYERAWACMQIRKGQSGGRKIKIVRVQ